MSAQQKLNYKFYNGYYSHNYTTVLSGFSEMPPDFGILDSENAPTEI